MCGHGRVCGRGRICKLFAASVESSLLKIRGRGLTRIINSGLALRKLTRRAQWADAIVLTDALYPSQPPRDWPCSAAAAVNCTSVSQPRSDGLDTRLRLGPVGKWSESESGLADSESRTDSGSDTASACGRGRGSVVKIRGLMRTQYFGIRTPLTKIHYQRQAKQQKWGVVHFRTSVTLTITLNLILT